MSHEFPTPKPISDIFIPAKEYRSPAWDEAERDKLWPHVWQMACRESEIESAGKFVAYEILDESILVVRTGDGVDDIDAFYNVCQHRGRRLVDRKRGTLANSITCHFHGWQYSRSGELEKVYVEEDWDGCPAFDKSKLSIPHVQVARWGGWVWINMDPDAEPLAEYLGAVPMVLDPFHLEDCRPKWWVTIHAPVNWKTVIEAFNEGYHSGATHKSGVSYWPLRSPTAPAGKHAGFYSDAVDFTEYKNDEGKWVKPASFVENLWANNKHLNRALNALTLAPGMAASERIRNLPEDSDPAVVMGAIYEAHKEEIEKSGAKFPETMTIEKWFAGGTDWHIFPNMIVLPTLDGALCYRLRPDADDRDKCVFDIWSLGRFAQGEEPQVEQQEFDSFEAFEGTNEFLEEDFGNLKALNKGFKSRGFRGATVNPVQEGTIANFHKVLREYLGDA